MSTAAQQDSWSRPARVPRDSCVCGVVERLEGYLTFYRVDSTGD